MPLCAALELVLIRRRTSKQTADSRQLGLVGEVRGGGDREVAVADVVARPRQWDCLQRLGRRAHQSDEAGVASRRDDFTVTDGNSVDAMPRLDDLAAADGDDQRLDGAEA